MERFTHRGVSLEYEDRGEGRPFLFLHGMGGSVKSILPLCSQITGLRLITLNQQGHGESGANWDTYSFDTLADDAAALLDHLGIEQAAAGGISMGAAVSLNLAIRCPERVTKLLLVRNAWTDQPMSEEVQEAYADLGRALHEGGPDAFRKTRGWKTVRDTSSSYTRNAFMSTFDDPACVRNWQKYFILPPRAPVISPREYEKLTMPVTIIACRGDLCHPFACGEYLAQQIGHASFMEIPNKDTDSAAHNRMIKEVIQADFAGPL